MRFGKLFAVALVISISVFAADPFLGKWKLNEQKTTVNAGQSPSNRTTTYETVSNGIRITMQGDGITGSDQVTLLFDGKDHPADTSQIVRNTGADTIVSKRPDPNSIDVTFKKGGKVVGTMKREVSKDGRTLTATADGVNTKGETFHNVLVYEKQ